MIPVIYYWIFKDFPEFLNRRKQLTADELKSLPKGNFVIMKTGVHPMQTKLRLFLEWGITFDKPYEMEEKSNRKVRYADKHTLEENVISQNMSDVIDEEGTIESTVKRQGGILHTPVHEQTDGSKADPKRKPILRT